MKKLQLALDFLSMKEAMKIARKTRKYIDFIEIGTPLIKSEGIKVVKKMKNKFSDKVIVADMKIADVGEIEAKLAFDAGADIVTVLSCVSDETIKGAIKVAKEMNKKVMVDLIGEHDFLKRAKEIEALGVDYLCVHTGIDEQKIGKEPFDDLSKIRNEVKTQIAVAGGINLDTVDRALELGADVIIVGSAITKNERPNLIARKIKKKILEFSD
jgi:3-hexulose-6-phosphate synthase